MAPNKNRRIGEPDPAEVDWPRLEASAAEKERRQRLWDDFVKQFPAEIDLHYLQDNYRSDNIEVPYKGLSGDLFNRNIDKLRDYGVSEQDLDLLIKGRELMLRELSPFEFFKFWCGIEE